MLWDDEAAGSGAVLGSRENSGWAVGWGGWDGIGRGKFWLMWREGLGGEGRGSSVKMIGALRASTGIALLRVGEGGSERKLEGREGLLSGGRQEEG